MFIRLTAATCWNNLMTLMNLMMTFLHLLMMADGVLMAVLVCRLMAVFVVKMV